MIKKRGFLFLLVLILLPSVFAFELSTIPPFLWIPFILILLVITIFILILIKDRLALKSLAIPTFGNVGEKKAKEGKKEITKEKESGEKKETKEKIDYFYEIDNLEQRLSQMDERTAYKKLMEIVRSFFSDYLNLNYQFTNEELEEELKKRKENILISSKALSKIEYSPEPVPGSELIIMIKEFKSLVKKINPPKISFEPSKDAKKINELLIKGNKIAEKNINKAINIYKKIYSLYYKLTKQEKAKLHKPILEFYKLIS